MKQLFTPRWLAGHLLALALVVLFITLGFWQLQRLREREAYNALLEARLSAEPQPFAGLLERFSASVPARAENSIVYRRATLTGRFDSAREVLLRSRALDGQPGYHVLTPLRLAGGKALLVDRGWVPFDLDEPPIRPASPPRALVSVTGFLQPAQVPVKGGFLGALGLIQKDPAEGELRAVFYVNPARLERQLPYRLEPVFLELSTQTPGQGGRLPEVPPPPEISRGPHLSYALQWFSFALIGIIGYIFLMRSVVREQQLEAKRARLGRA